MSIGDTFIFEKLLTLVKKQRKEQGTLEFWSVYLAVREETILKAGKESVLGSSWRCNGGKDKYSLGCLHKFRTRPEMSKSDRMLTDLKPMHLLRRHTMALWWVMASHIWKQPWFSVFFFLCADPVAGWKTLWLTHDGWANSLSITSFMTQTQGWLGSQT